MCDYCGCRSEPPLEELGQEHAEILGHLGSIERALSNGDMPTAQLLLEHVLQHLHLHIEKEDRGLFAQLRAESELLDEVETLAIEHSELWEMVASLPQDDDQWVAAIHKLIKTLRDHIHVEEYDLFPASFQVLSDAGWIAVRSVHHQLASHEIAQ